MRIILASGSPRRKQLMELVGIDCEVLVTNVDEPITEDAETLVRELAMKKNQAACDIVTATKQHEDAVIITADTLVSIDGKVLEKPSSQEEAFVMLKMLSGKKHTVYTGVMITKLGKRSSTCSVFVESADVFFRELSDDDINAYIRTGEPFDKAGAYGVQEKGALLVQKVHGDFYTVVGLPIMKVGYELSKMGVDIWQAGLL